MAGIATVAEYKTYAGISVSTWDTQFGVFVDAANDLIPRYCNRTSFDSSTYTEVHSTGPDQATITVRVPPITSITSIKRLLGTSDTVTLDSDTYTFDANSGLVKLWGAGGGTLDEWGMRGFNAGALVVDSGPRFEETVLGYQVVYVGGYATMPNGLKLALYRIVDGMRARVGRDPRLQSESIGAYSYSLAAADSQGGIISPEVQAILNPYRREGT